MTQRNCFNKLKSHKVFFLDFMAEITNTPPAMTTLSERIDSFMKFYPIVGNEDLIFRLTLTCFNIK